MLKMPAYYRYTSREDRSMYKNISFQEAEFGEKKFLMYRVDDAKHKWIMLKWRC